MSVKKPTRVFQPFLHHLSNLLSLLWAFTESDFLTFAIPNSLFGIFSALALPALIDTSLDFTITTSSILLRAPLVVLFNVGNLLIFDLANRMYSTIYLNFDILNCFTTCTTPESFPAVSGSYHTVEILPTISTRPASETLFSLHYSAYLALVFNNVHFLHPRFNPLFLPCPLP